MILEVYASGPAETNSYLLGCEETRQAAVIDVPFDSAIHHMKRAQELSLDIEMIFLTHSHWDHTAEAALLKDKLGIPLFVHAEDAENVKDPGSDQLPLLFPITGVEPDSFLTDGQVIPLGKLSIEVIHTAGHTPGGVCFYIPEKKILFSGDTLFRGTIGNLSFPTGRPESMWKSLQHLASLPEETIVYPGHGGPTTIGKEQWIKNLSQ